MAMVSTELPGTSTMTFSFDPKNLARSFSRMLTVLQATTPPSWGCFETRIVRLCFMWVYYPFRKACLCFRRLSLYAEKRGVLRGMFSKNLLEFLFCSGDRLTNGLDIRIFTASDLPHGKPIRQHEQPSALDFGQGGKCRIQTRIPL